MSLKSCFTKISAALLLLLSSGYSTLYAQNPDVYYYENEFFLKIPTQSAWSFELGIGNRAVLQEKLSGEKISGYQHDHIELNQFSYYNTSENLSLSLGLRYRFRETFDADETNEFRLIQQLEYEHPDSPIGLEHRIRIEQRFREATIFRARYELETSYPINSHFAVGADTEALYGISPSLKPEAEQRFSLGLENSSFKKLELELKLEYRMENYARDLENEYFIITELVYEL